MPRLIVATWVSGPDPDPDADADADPDLEEVGVGVVWAEPRRHDAATTVHSKSDRDPFLEISFETSLLELEAPVVPVIVQLDNACEIGSKVTDESFL